VREPGITGIRILRISWFSLKFLRSWEVLFVLATSLAMVCLNLLSIHFLELVEMKAWDLHFTRRGPIAPSKSVAFVSIDEESVNRDGRWPWPRRQMASLLKAVQEHGAKAIGLDMGFFEPDLKLGQKAILNIRDKFQHESAFQELIPRLEALAEREDDDFIMAETIRNLPIPIVLGHFFYIVDEYAEKGSGRKDDGFIPPKPPLEVLQKAACPRVIKHQGQIPLWGRLKEADGFEANIPIIEEASRYMGSFNTIPEQDGSVRRMPLVVRYEERLFPSLALQMLSAAFPEKALTIRMNKDGIMEIRLGDILIPTNKKGQMLLNFYGPPYSFEHFSASALLHKELPQDCLEDRLVVIGNTTMGLFDMRPTPFSEMFPGVELHCVVMENILKQQFLVRPNDYILFDGAAIFILALCFLVLQSRLRGLYLSAAVAVLLGGYIYTTHYLFLGPGLWVSHIYPSLTLVIGYIGTSAHRYMKEEREKRQIRQTFSLYVPRSVVEEMLEHPERLRLGGEKKELTVFFSDIRGFTTLSEQLPPEELVPQLNEYLTRMSQVVFDHQGTLDKYIGDAIMAIFGAPLTQEDHSYRACVTALDMIRTLEKLQREWKAQSKPVLHIGVGINTGLMMVGNMGSERRFDYTVLGDNVNLASRLEGLTKKYGVTIVISETTWGAVKGRFVGRELDVVQVKGKRKPVAIYELIARSEEADAYREPLEVYHEALAQFRRKNWQGGLELFQKVESWWPGDPPSVLYQKRCRDLLENHPEESWSFVTILDSK
jgi:adenylate cyclase